MSNLNQIKRDKNFADVNEAGEYIEEQPKKVKLCECPIPGLDYADPFRCPTCKRPHRPVERSHE